MSIILNECECAKQAIYDCDLGAKPYETITRVAKYYLHNGMSKTEARTQLDLFLTRCDPTQSVVRWSDSLDRALKYALKHPIVNIDSIKVSRAELDTISKLQGKQLQRFAFTLLCISKYSHEAFSGNDYWVNVPDNEIMRMANIRTSIKRQSLMYSQLKDAGVIRFSKLIDNLSVQVLFVDNESNTVLEIKDFRNLGYQYLMHLGEPYYVCQHCGLVCKVPDPAYAARYKYCSECAVKIRTQQNVNSVMRRRNQK